MGSPQVALLAALCAAAGIGSADASGLEFHCGLQDGACRVELRASDGATVAATVWDSVVPLRDSADDTVVHVPSRVLALLRDAVAAGHRRDAGALANELRALLGREADLAPAAIPRNHWSSLLTIETPKSWCGKKVDENKRCPDNCTSDSTKTCAGCGCRGTKTSLAPTF